MLYVNFDDQGLIIQQDGDGGDCAARSGELITGRLLSDPASTGMIGVYCDKVLKLLEPNTDGIILRYNRVPYNDPYTPPFATSRDQIIPLVIAAGFADRSDFVKRVWKETKSNWMRFPNGDLCSPEHIAVFIRAWLRSNEATGLQLLWMIPLLFFGDLFNLLNSIIRIIKSHQDHDDVGDDINHVQVCLLSIHTKLTLLSQLSILIYGKYRWSGVQYAFDHYHRPETNGNPLNELYRPLIQKYFE